MQMKKLTLLQIWRNQISSQLFSALVVLFLFSQTAGLIHAEVHHFHEHEAECDIYQAVEKKTAHIQVHALVPLLDWGNQSLTSPFSKTFPYQTLNAFSARAPPFSLS
jgi:hypothetical protein